MRKEKAACLRQPSLLLKTNFYTVSNSALYCMGSFIPENWFLTEISLICHMTGNCCMIPEYSVLNNRFTRPYRFEEIPHMRIEIIPVVATIVNLVIQRFLSQFRSMFSLPFSFIFSSHLLWKTSGVIAGCKIYPGLRCIAEIEFACIENALGTHKACQLRSLSPKS